MRINFQKNRSFLLNKRTVIYSVTIIIVSAVIASVFLYACSNSKNAKEPAEDGTVFSETLNTGDSSTAEAIFPDTETAEAEIPAGQETGTEAEITASNDVLIAASDTNFPPFEYLEDGKPVGFDVDMINEITKRLGKEVLIESFVWDPEFRLLRNGEFDLIISAVQANKDKDSIVDFSNPYFNMKYLLISLIGSEYNIKEKTTGQNVGILDTGIDFLDETYVSSFKIIKYSDIIEMIEALKSKEIAAVLLNLPIGVNLLKENKDIYFILEEVSSNKSFSIVFQEGSPLKTEVDRILDEMVKDGTYDKIYKQWFGYDL